MTLASQVFLALLVASGGMILNTQDKTLIDFTQSDEAARWVTVNDNVMGGRSEGGPAFAESRLIFSGSTNTNGGGFSSIRTKPGDWDLKGFDGLVMRARGSRRTFQFDLGYDGRISRRRTAFRATFTPSEEWQEIRIPFTAFAPTFFGRTLEGPEAPVLDAGNVATLGFFIYDKLDGPFTLEVDWIKAYRKVAEQPRRVQEPDLESARLQGFMSARLGVPVTTDSLAGSLGDSSQDPRIAVMISALEENARLEYMRIHQPQVFRLRLSSPRMLLDGSDLEWGFDKKACTGAQSPARRAAALSLWSEITSRDPDLVRKLVGGLRAGDSDFKSIRQAVQQATGLEVEGPLRAAEARRLLSLSFGESSD